MNTKSCLPVQRLEEELCVFEDRRVEPFGEPAAVADDLGLATNFYVSAALNPAGGILVYFTISRANGAIYAEENDRILRYPLPPERLRPPTAREVIVSGLPVTGDHPLHPPAGNRGLAE